MSMGATDEGEWGEVVGYALLWMLAVTDSGPADSILRGTCSTCGLRERWCTRCKSLGAKVSSLRWDEEDTHMRDWADSTPPPDRGDI